MREGRCQLKDCDQGYTIRVTTRTGPIPRYHAACWIKARGGAPAMSTYSKRKRAGLCVVCELPAAPHAYCADCRKDRRNNYQEGKEK